MDHENREAQQISALELQLKSNFRPGLRFPSYLYDFSASKFQICDRNLGFSAIFLGSCAHIWVSLQACFKKLSL